jgi:glycerol-3-phosphate acyltransferase PlsY
MVGQIVLIVLAIGIAYLLGSIPSAYLVGRWLKGIDMREVGDGRMGMAETYRRVGVAGASIVFFMDVGKGLAAMMLAKLLGLPLGVLIFVGLAAVVGHNWSIFMQFKGGKGALTTYGVLASVMFWQLWVGLAVGGIALLIIHKTGFSTGILFCAMAVLNLIIGSAILLVIFPLVISLPMFVKHISMPKPDTAAAGVEGHSGEDS